MKTIITSVILALLVGSTNAEEVNHEAYSKIETIIFSGSSPITTQEVATVVFVGKITEAATSFHYDCKAENGKRIGIHPFKFLITSPKQLSGQEIAATIQTPTDKGLIFWETGSEVEFKALAMGLHMKDGNLNLALSDLLLIGEIKTIKPNQGMDLTRDDAQSIVP